MIPTVNEQSRCWVKAKFYDKSDNLQTPTAMQYRIDCETTRQTVLDWTSFTPASTVEIFIPASLNNIINPVNSVERKVVTVQANSDTPDQAFNQVHKYDLVRLQGITVPPVGNDYGNGP